MKKSEIIQTMGIEALDLIKKHRKSLTAGAHDKEYWSEHDYGFNAGQNNCAEDLWTDLFRLFNSKWREALKEEEIE